MNSSISTAIPFTKANACGNDFLIVDGSFSTPDISVLSRRMCDRHNGVGADGVEWLFPSSDADISAQLINSDGSSAEISGNGTRCVAAYLCAQHSLEGKPKDDGPKEEFTISTGAGIKVCQLTSHHDCEYEFEIAMGEPHVGDELSLALAGCTVHGITLSMGNPHYVVFVNGFAPEWQTQAAEIGRRSEFPQGVNVELVRVVDRHNIEPRFFERGAGETESSGTGSCASAVAAITAGLAESPVRVHAPGGTQTVRWAEQVFLRGSARIVCQGEYFA